MDITGQKERERAKLPLKKKKTLCAAAALPEFYRSQAGEVSPPPPSFGFRPFPFSSVCLRRLYLSFRPIADLPPSPMGLKLLARRHQPGFQKRIHGIEAAVVHSVVPVFLRSRPPSPFSSSGSRIPLHSFHPHCRSFLFVSCRHTWCSPLLGNLTFLGLSRDLLAPSIIESELKESPSVPPRK